MNVIAAQGVQGGFFPSLLSVDCLSMMHFTQLVVFLIMEASVVTQDAVQFTQNVTLADRLSVGTDANVTQEVSRLACAERCASQTSCTSFFYCTTSGQCAMLSDHPARTIQSNHSTRFYQRVKNETSDPCPASDGFVFVPHLNYCFRIFLDVVNHWDLAIQACQDAGLQLAILHPDDRLTAVRNTILGDTAYLTPSGIDYYIGASMPRSQWDVSTNKPYTNWFWTDGTPVTTAFWGKNQPGGLGEDHVLCLYAPNYDIFDRPSTRPYRYVCQKDL